MHAVKIAITHKGEDCYKIEVDGKEYEVDWPIGDLVQKQLDMLKKVVVR